MNRLISKDPVTGELTCSTRDFDKFFPTLYAYEETGFTPADVLTLERSYESLIRQLEERLRSWHRSNMSGTPWLRP